MLQSAHYPNNRGDLLTVAYVIFRNNLCVFSAIDSSNLGSSINYAEDIVESIAKTEGRSVQSMRYFDLQTRTSYGSHPASKPNPGDFELDEVKIEMRGKDLYAASWRPTLCPAHVSKLFEVFIGGVPKQQLRQHPQEVVF